MNIASTAAAARSLADARPEPIARITARLRTLLVALVALAGLAPPAPAIAQATTAPVRDSTAKLREFVSRDPSDALARMALADALRDAGQLQTARYHYELALGAGLEPELADRALLEIRRIREQSTTASFAIVTLPRVTSRTVVADDGTSSTVRGNSSYGVGIQTGGRLALGDDLRTFVRGALDLREYAGRRDDFDYGQLSAGRVERAGRVTFTAELGGLGSVFAGRYWYRGGFAQVGGIAYLDPRLTWSNTVLARRIDYTILQGATANQGFLFSDLRWLRPQATTFATGFTAGASRAVDTWRGYDYGEWRASALQEWRRGFIADTALAVSTTRYRATEPGFDRRRRDLGLGFGVGLTWREFTLLGLAPRVGVSWQRINSNIDVNDTRQVSGGFGLTSNY